MNKPVIKAKEKKTKNVSARISERNYFKLEDINIKLGYSVSDVLEFGIKFIEYELSKKK